MLMCKSTFSFDTTWYYTETGLTNIEKINLRGLIKTEFMPKTIVVNFWVSIELRYYLQCVVVVLRFITLYTKATALD